MARVFEKKESESDAQGHQSGPSQHSRLRKDSLWMMSGQSMSVAFQALYFVLIGRALGSRDYGLFVGVASLISVLGQFSCLGMELILIRDVSRDPKLFRRSWGLALEISLMGFVVITLIAMAVGHIFLSPETRTLVPMIALSDVLFAKISLLASKAYQSLGRFRESANLIGLTNLGRAVVAAWLFFNSLRLRTHATAYQWTQIYWISSAAVAIISFVVVSRQLGLPQICPIERRTLNDGFSFSLSGSSISVYNDIDKTMLSGFGQPQAAGIYAAAYRIVDVASTPIYSIYAAAFPQFFREGAKSVRHAANFALRLSRKTVTYSLVIGVAMYAGAGSLPYFLGKSFTPSVEALRWLCLLPLIRCFHYAGGTTITGSTSQWYRTIQQVFVALLNICLNAVLIPKFSWRGAAAASLFTDATLAGLNWACVRWLIKRQETSAQVQLV